LKTRAILKLGLDGERTGRSLLSVLAPDNRVLPRGLLLSVRGAAGEATFNVQSSSASTTLSTVLALLRDIELFQEVWLLSHREDGRDRRA